VTHVHQHVERPRRVEGNRQAHVAKAVDQEASAP
jgi:hypothetical protein